jgi:hypothetical protein
MSADPQAFHPCSQLFDKFDARLQAVETAAVAIPDNVEKARLLSSVAACRSSVSNLRDSIYDADTVLRLAGYLRTHIASCEYQLQVTLHGRESREAVETLNRELRFREYFEDPPYE